MRRARGRLEFESDDERSAAEKLEEVRELDVQETCDGCDETA